MKSGCKVSNLLLLAIVLAGVLHTTATAQNTNTSSYYRQAYDQGFQAAQADANAGRPYSYQTALVTAGGLSGISRDYRNAFKAGYQDGYYNRNNAQNGDYYYRRHHHDGDCVEDGSPGQRGNSDFNCRGRHDNGLHRGWYKNHGRGNENGPGRGRGRGHGNKHDKEKDHDNDND